MKKMSLFMGMIAFISITTSCEQDAPTEQSFNAKAGFDAEATYWEILNDTENGMQTFDALSNAKKAAVWEFKYNRFKSDNALSVDQIAAVDLAIDLVQNISFDEGNQTEEQNVEEEIRNVFDQQTSDFLLLTLENNSSDVATEGCFWCLDPTGNTKGCCAYRDPTDGHIVELRSEVEYRVRVFWIGWSSRWYWQTCDVDSWISNGLVDCQI